MGSLTQAPAPRQGRLSEQKQRQLRVAAAKRQVYVSGPIDSHWMRRALDASISTGTARNALGALLLIGQGERYVAASFRDVANVANTSQDWAAKCLKELRALGEITVYRRGGGGRTPNTYELHLPLPEKPQKGGDAA